MTDTPRDPSGWQLEEAAAAAYERYFVPVLFAPWAERLVSSADLRPGERVLDVACGTGIVARCAAPYVGDQGGVVGVDINDGMLAVAAETAAEYQPSIEWRHGDATDLPFSDGTFDVALCQQALQYFADPDGALREIHRVLTPDGRAILSVWRPLEYNHGYAVFADALERHLTPAAGEMMRAPFPAWDRGTLHDLVEDAGFDNRSVVVEIGSIRYPSVVEFIRRELASSPLADELADAAHREPLVREVAERLDAYCDDDGIILPMESYVITVR